MTKPTPDLPIQEIRRKYSDGVIPMALCYQYNLPMHTVREIVKELARKLSPKQHHQRQIVWRRTVQISLRPGQGLKPPSAFLEQAKTEIGNHRTPTLFDYDEDELEFYDE